MKRKNGDSKENSNVEEKKKYKSSSTISDTKLLSRVQQYLEENKHRQMISISSMVEYLQATYSRDYGRKKKNAFRIYVEKVYKELSSRILPGSTANEDYSRLEKKHLQKAPNVLVVSDSEDSSLDSDESFSSNNPDYAIHEDTNAMNSIMMNLYKKQTASQSGVDSPLRGSKPHSASNSAPSTPQRRGQTEDSDVFLIDRIGEREGKAQNSRRVKSEKQLASVGSSDSSFLRSSDGGKPKQQTKKARRDGKLNDFEVVPDSASEQEERLGPACLNSASDKPEVAGDANSHDTSKKKKPAKTPKKRVATESGNSEKKSKNSRELQTSTVTFADVGGNDSTLKEVCKLLVHMKHPEVYERLGVTPPRGFLLHGPPGCGKSLLAHAISGELDLPMLRVAATELVSGVSGESEEKIRDIFQIATASAPCVMFLDEIDAITPKRETASKDMERRIVSQLLTCLDDLGNVKTGHVLVIGATNRPDALDPALRRAGRFDREIALGIPDEDARTRILQVLCRDLRLASDFDFRRLARSTPGYVGADLMALASEAAIVAVNRVFKELQDSPQQQSRAHTRTQSPAYPGASIQGPTMCTNTPDQIPTRISHTEVILSECINENPETSNVANSINENVSPVQGISTECVLEQIEGEICDSPGDTNNQVEVASSLEHEECRQSDVNQQESQAAEAEYKLVLSWLKDQPPLSKEQLDTLYLTMDDFQMALQHVQPSAKREGFATIPDVTWEDIGALQGVREELQIAIMGPVRHPEQFKALGLTNPPGILLAGPPGCGKTLLAKAVANESGINFISVKGPELLNMYVGESERAVRQVFQRARNSSPCVIFFDELDALCPRRSDSGEGGASVRVVNQLLTEMDGLQARKQVFIMGATNRPDIIDPAVLRPGRLDKLLYVGLPGPDDRLDILRTVTRNGTKPRLAADVNLQDVVNHPKCHGFSGADLAALVREASVAALKEMMSQSQPSTQVTQVSMSHFEQALSKVRPSVTSKDQDLYLRMRERISTS